MNTTNNGKRIDWKKAYAKLQQMQSKLHGALKRNAAMEELAMIQNEIINSFAARVIAVRKVTTNKGKKTAGIDKIVGTTDAQKDKAISDLQQQRWSKYRAKPVRRVGIDKADSTLKRPLGIPTLFDRAVQTLFSFVLDVHQEHAANPRSFGFRKGRNAKQAMNYAGKLCSGAGKRGVLKIDVRKAYDRVSHDWLRENIPINKFVLDEWLKAGVIENGKRTELEQGVPQGSVISPIIFNCVMNGIETEILTTGAFPIRYADDIFVFGKTKQELEKAKEIIENFLKPRGLEINEEKTKFVPIEIGVDVLGFNIREYSDVTRTKNPSMKTKKGILLVKPSKRSIENFRSKISEVLEKRKKSTAYTVIMELNLIIRGWSNYFKSSSGWTKAKNKLGFGLFRKLLKGVYKKHSGIQKRRTLVKRYFKAVQRRKTYFNAGTFFGVQQGTEVLIIDIQEIKVERENELKFDPSPNPYNVDDYMVFDKKLKTQAKKSAALAKGKMRILESQKGICNGCNQIIELDGEKVEIDHIIEKADGGTDKKKNLQVIHKTCHDQKTAWARKARANKKHIRK